MVTIVTVAMAISVLIYRYPAARCMRRHFIIHAGPTNSGKTHNALEEFLSAENGVYCAPLRLLAAEIRQRSMARVSPKCLLERL